MKKFKFVLFLLMAIFSASTSFANTPYWQNDKLDINVYSKKNDKNNFNILVELSLKNGWTIFWDNPGDAGTPTTFDWNSNIKRINASKPEKIVYEDSISFAFYGYSDKAYYLFEGNSSDNNMSVNISWGACKDECEKENASINFSLDTDSNLYDNIYEQAKATFPITLNNLAYSSISHQSKDDIYLLNLFIKDFKLEEKITSAYFIPYQKISSYNAYKQDVNFEKGLLQIKFHIDRPVTLSQGGLVVVNDEAYEVNFTPQDTNPPALSVAYILLLAFIGGLILNFMPCVFPVLSLKALTFKQTANKTENIKCALAYLSGVVSSFLVMAFLLYVFRKTGQAIGWGFQLQSPIFVCTMLIIFIVLFLMILDVIVIKSDILNVFNKLGSVNDFMAGFFAVLIASPCTGPFLGAVLGFTLIQSPSVYFMIFLSLGLGYGLPFALLEIYPEKISKILPKSGKWLKNVKHVLALPVLLTCIWLAWVLYHQTLLSQKTTEHKYWKPYDEVEIRSLINQDQPVFIDFTAKWCLTCLLNEKTVLNTDDFIKFAQENNIHLFKADWTEQNENIGKAIKSFGRNSVPLYIYYPKRKQNYVILPQILEAEHLKSALNGKN